MKKSLFYYLFAVLCAVNLFSSCSENESIAVPIDSELAGKYKGKLDVSISQNGTEIPGGTINSQIINVTKAGDNAVSLSITDFSFMEIEIGDINLENCVLTANGDNYEFTGTTKVEAELLTADVDATGVFSNGSLNLNLDIDATLTGGVKQAVKVTYSGTRLKGDESSEAKITSFVFDTKVAEVDSLVIGESVINEEAKTITFMVADTAKAEYLTALVPTIEVSKGATVVPASGEAQDFSNGKVVTYTVTAEDGTVAEYKASISGNVVVYDFENWTVDKTQTSEENQYPIAEGGWASCNQAVLFIKAFGAFATPPISYTGGWPITSTQDVHSGKLAASMESVDTQGSDNMMGQKVPKVTAGSLFLGNFNPLAAMYPGGAMKTTEFGIPYYKEPVKVTGYYKYTPGTEFYNADGKLQEGVTDKCSLSAVLYEVSNENETLYGDDIYTSDKIVAKVIFTSDQVVEEYTPFELNLEYVKEYNPEKLYKFAVIFSASADGAAYNAAVGSKLVVDNVAIINK